MTTTLMTYNIRNGRAFDGRNLWWLRRRAVLDVIRSVGPDIVGLQEVYGFQLHYLRRHLAGFDVEGHGRAARGRGEHVPVLVRADRFDVEGSETRWFGVRPLARRWELWGRHGSRVVTLVRLRHRATGRSVGVANTHLDPHSAGERDRSTATLVRWLAEEPDRPWVVLGDLNATVAEPAVALVLAAGYEDVLARMAPAGPGVATAHGFSGSFDGGRIDHVLVPADLGAGPGRILHRRPRGRLASDHWPVVAEIDV